MEGVRRRYAGAASSRREPSKRARRARDVGSARRARPDLPRLPAAAAPARTSTTPSLAAALVRAGHEVHLLCQDRDAARAGVGRRRRRLGRRRAGGRRRGASRSARDRLPARHRRPAAASTSPTATTASRRARSRSCSDARARRATSTRNVAAVREVAARVAARRRARQPPRDGPGRSSPARSRDRRPVRGQGPRQRARVHGQAASARFLPVRARGPRAARAAMLVGSRHTAESLWAAMDDPGAARRAPGSARPGVDVARFTPRAPAAARAGLERAARAARARRRRRRRRRGSSFARDAGEAAARARRRVEPGRDRLVVFVGKLIASKGVELLLAAWPLVLAREPRARLADRRLRRLPRRARGPGRATLARGDLDAAARRCAARTARELPHLRGVPRRARRRAAAYRAAAARHDATAIALGRPARPRRADRPAAGRRGDGVPSTFPEAFGMVAAEAAACGALPVVARPLRPGRGRRARWRAAVARAGAPVADLRASGPAPVRELAERPRGLARGARGRCAPRPARRSWRRRASATRGTASRGR